PHAHAQTSQGSPGKVSGWTAAGGHAADDRQAFQRSVIYLCAHSDKGAMGLIVNQRAPHISFQELLGQLNISTRDPERATTELIDISVHVGGPVETGRGFVLHSSDYYAADSTLAIDETVSLTATVDILKAMATGRGPGRAILALGYAGWRAG